MADERTADRHEEPLSRKISVARLPREGERLHIEADESERADLAEFLSIPGVNRFTAELTVSPWRRDGVSVKGRFEAEIVQESVVTLELIAQSLAEPVTLLYVPETSRLARPRLNEDGELHLDPEGDDPPDTFVGDSVDIGASLRELLVLSLDPYPREPTAAFEPGEDAVEPADEGKKVSPFATLARLKSGTPDE